MKSAALASSVIFLFSLLNTYESFRHICKSSRRSSQISNVFSTDFEELSRICKSVAVSTNQTATLVNFIQLGDIWAAETSKNAIGEFKRFREGDKVPGCMADVRITTSFQYPARNLAGLTSVSSSNPTITIDGSADSRVAQGILALLCKGLENQLCSKVLTLSPTELSRECGLSILLPVGRLNGLHNMISVIQKQISCELSKLDQDKVDQVIKVDEFSKVGSMMGDESKSNDIDSSDEIAVLLSGGVDSSVALKLLQLQGHKVRAFYLKIWLEDEVAHLNECPWEEDLGYAESVCAQLGVPLETLSLQKEYWEEVVQYTFREARAGRTPNPDVLCNSRIKFGMFYNYVGKHYSKIATGHYAQVLYGDESVQQSNLMFAASKAAAETVATPSAVIEISDSDTYSNGLDSIPHSDVADTVSYRSISEDPGPDSMNTGARLVMSPDSVKDQTYFLSALSQEQLAKAIFPIGHLQKHEVRVLAEKYQLPTRARKDSQGICFLGKLKFDEFIEHYLGENEGPIRCYQTGKILGVHRGLWFHTIGQRKGLGLQLQSVVHDGPWFVAAKDADTNTVYVTNDLSVVERPRIEFRVHKMNWVSGRAPPGLRAPGGLTMDVKLRHGPTLSRATITVSDSSNPSVTPNTQSGEESDVLRVVLAAKDKGIAPGQFAAFYSGSECLGAGVIVDTAVDEILRQEEHITIAKSKSVKSNPNARSAMGA